MTHRLEIRLEGPSGVLGSPAQGVSLAFFADFAKRLRDAYQRSAQVVLTGTTQDTGRLPKRATEVDVRLVTAQAGSLNLDVVPVSTATGLFPDPLATGAMFRLLSELETLRQHPDHADASRWVRSLVATVPAEVSQRYTLYEGNDVSKSVTLTSAMLGEEAEEPVMARVERLPCQIRGVLCLPRPAVILETAEGRFNATADDNLTAEAWRLRDEQDLIATIVTNKHGRRLLALRTAAEQATRTRVPSHEETLARYAGILRRLA